MLRKPDRRRSTTQTWSFHEGKLTCGLHGLVVQVSYTLSCNSQGQNKASSMLCMMNYSTGKINQSTGLCSYFTFVKGSQETFAVHLCVSTWQMLISFFKT
jgi:hypothetical protein